MGRQEKSTEENSDTAGLVSRVPSLRIAAATHPGCERDNNEDSVLVFQTTLLRRGSYLPIGLAVLADGLGGYGEGEEASDLAVRIVGEKVTAGCILPMMCGENALPINDMLFSAISAANTAVIEAAAGSGRATTLTAAFVLGEMAYLIHVGDCRAYSIDAEGARQITRDHTFLQRLVDLGQLTPEQARLQPELRKLYKALGRQPQVEPEAYARTLKAGTRLLLCSDGVWEMLEDDAMAAIVNGSDEAQAACRGLIEAAYHAGGPDNLTALIIENAS